MAIEVTSMPDRADVPHRIVGSICTVVQELVYGRYRLFLRLLTAIFIFAAITAGHTLFQSYRYYSRIIDSRLARGYLTSRAGLYAAPTVLRPRQGLSASDLVSKLQRAGYVEGSTSDVWSGSFSHQANYVEIRPTPAHGLIDTSPVRVTFDTKDRIESLTQDGISLESFGLEPEALTNDASTKIGEHRALMFDQIPPDLVHAILSIEDRRFFQHPGLDPLGIARALLRNAGDDGVGQGGSTITQQLVKNTYLSPERSFRRKYAEAMLAFALERRLSKEDIFALYCNEIYLGHRGAVAVRGIYQASQIYFGKEPGKLTLAEAATVAGMIQGPSRYSPVRHADATRERRNLVLEAMVQEKWISREQAKSAASEPVSVVPNQDGGSLAPYFIDFVNRSDEASHDVPGEEQRIYTTIDLDLQRLAEAALERQLTRLERRKENTLQAALVALNPHNGDVLAMVGGRDYATSQLNRATDALRQPGSTFKPFVYAAALEDGMSPVQLFADAPQEFVYDRNRIYKPVNFGGGYSMRDVTMRTGLVQSLNTVSVAVAMQTGLARIANLAERFGLPKPERYPSLALGTSEVTPLELAAAYATFVNGGRRVQPRVTINVGSSEGASSDTGVPVKQVISPTTAYMITNMLSAVVDHGTGRAARTMIKGTAIAGKTGTSRDSWFVGYTPNLVCVVWIGFDDNAQSGLTGSQAALPAWADFMQAAIARRPELGDRNFECPEGIKFVEIDNDTGLLSTLTCPNRELIAVTDRLAPHAECYRHSNLLWPPEEEKKDRGPSDEQPRAVTMPFVDIAKSLFRTTVEVDTTGRRTLVTDMR